jgi:hypothetical protein
VIEKPDGELGKVDVVSDIRAAQDRKSPVVNARKARCQNFESNFIGEYTEDGGRSEGGDNGGTIERGRRNLVSGKQRRQSRAVWYSTLYPLPSARFIPRKATGESH